MYSEMAHHSETRMAGLCRNLNELRVKEKYTDVTVECKDQSFKCHRVALAAASDVFDCMFSSNFIEGTADTISLPKISAQTFNEILQFIYIGDVCISSTNVLMLIEASDFFQLSDLEKLCIQFLNNNIITAETILKTFTFACQTKKHELIDLLSRKIAMKFNLFSKASQLLDVSFDVLEIILKQLSSLPPYVTDLDEMCDFIVRWIQHSREQRIGLLDKITDEIEFYRISPEYAKCLFKKIVCNLPSTPTPESSTVTDTTSNDIEISESSMEKHLYVYVKNSGEDLMNVFSVGGGIDNNYSTILSYKLPSIADQWMRIVTLHDSYVGLYCLKYAGRSSEKTPYDQYFNFCTSLNLDFPKLLTSPPVILDDVQLSPFKNTIYLYNRTHSKQRVIADGLTKFSDDEISRGLYLFDCDMDNWFPVPARPNPFRESSMIICGDLLYMIGGIYDEGGKTNNVQAFDYRMGTWLGINSSSYWYAGSDCCVVKDKIYVCGGGGNGVESYDPAAGKWNRLASLPTGMRYHRVVSYMNKIWVMGNFIRGVLPGNKLDVYIYDPVLDVWNASRVLKDASRTYINTSRGIIVDCIVY